MKLALGTFQFGLDYGITNSDGQASNSEVEKILDFSLKNGIKVLDTASSYGNSEKVLGKIGVNDYQVITKTIPLKDDVNEVIDGFYKSLENLNKDQIEGLLIHNINDIENKQFDVLFNKLSKLKKEQPESLSFW